MDVSCLAGFLHIHPIVATNVHCCTLTIGEVLPYPGRLLRISGPSNGRVFQPGVFWGPQNDARPLKRVRIQKGQAQNLKHKLLFKLYFCLQYISNANKFKIKFAIGWASFDLLKMSGTISFCKFLSIVVIHQGRNKQITLNNLQVRKRKKIASHCFSQKRGRGSSDIVTWWSKH